MKKIGEDLYEVKSLEELQNIETHELNDGDTAIVKYEDGREEVYAFKEDWILQNSNYVVRPPTTMLIGDPIQYISTDCWSQIIPTKYVYEPDNFYYKDGRFTFLNKKIYICNLFVNVFGNVESVQTKMTVNGEIWIASNYNSFQALVKKFPGDIMEFWVMAVKKKKGDKSVKVYSHLSVMEF